MLKDKLYAFETTVRVASFIINALPLEDIIRGYCYLLQNINPVSLSQGFLAATLKVILRLDSDYSSYTDTVKATSLLQWCTE